MNISLSTLRDTEKFGLNVLEAALACPKQLPIYGSAEFRDKRAPTSAAHMFCFSS